MSRPSIYSNELATRICELIADGKSLRSICTADDMPARSSVRLWLTTNEEFSAQYARAEAEQADNFAEEIVEIADDDTLKPDVARVRIDARKWRAARQAPKRWGDKVEIGGKLDSTVTVDASGLPPALRFLAGHSETAEG